MTYNTIKFEIFLEESLVLDLKNLISKFLNEYSSPIDFYTSKDYYNNNFKIEFFCNKDYAFEIISIIKNSKKEGKISFNIIPLIN